MVAEGKSFTRTDVEIESEQYPLSILRVMMFVPGDE
jgi:hypothetical protein